MSSLLSLCCCSQSERNVQTKHGICIGHHNYSASEHCSVLRRAWCRCWLLGWHYATPWSSSSPCSNCSTITASIEVHEVEGSKTLWFSKTLASFPPFRRGRGMYRGRGRQFSCTECREETMYDPYVCQNCYRGADGDEPFKCRRCKYVGSRSQPFVCQKCSKGPRFQKMFIKNKKQFLISIFRWLQFLHQFFNFY